MSDTTRYIQRWTSAYQKYRSAWTVSQQSWLLDRSSLTKRLKRHSRSSFEVIVKKEGIDRLFQHEKRILKNHSNTAWVREVELVVDGKTWVFARSAVPLSTLKGEDLKLRYLGKKPLGQLLFSNPRYQRNAFQIGWALDSQGNKRWGRRSTFSCQGTHRTLLVSETFMPIVF